MSSSLTPRKITSLCAKEVISVAYGSGPHLLALTKGKNEFSLKILIFYDFEHLHIFVHTLPHCAKNRCSDALAAASDYFEV